MKKVYSVRQGDVLLIDAKYRGDNLEAIEVKAEKNKVVLAEGEVTGHAHVCVIDREQPQVKVFEAQAERYLQIVETIALTHEEHTTILLRKGRLQQAFQVEDFGEEVRRVTD